jgi:hypothetical protein
MTPGVRRAGGLETSDTQGLMRSDAPLSETRLIYQFFQLLTQGPGGRMTASQGTMSSNPNKTGLGRFCRIRIGFGLTVLTGQRSDLSASCHKLGVVRSKFPQQLDLVFDPKKVGQGVFSALNSYALAIARSNAPRFLMIQCIQPEIHPYSLFSKGAGMADSTSKHGFLRPFLSIRKFPGARFDLNKLTE